MKEKNKADVEVAEAKEKVSDELALKQQEEKAAANKKIADAKANTAEKKAKAQEEMDKVEAEA